MTREEALKLVVEKIKTKNLLKHCLAVEAVMRKLAKHSAEDIEKWGLCGLLHDIDYEETKNDLKRHSLVGAEFLEKLGVDSEIVQAVRVHNEVHNLPLQTKMDKALFCSDPITGLIVAAALVLPDKKLKSLTPQNVLNRYKEKGFARAVNRKQIAGCQNLGLSLEDFVKLSLEAMQEISSDLGL